MPHECSVVGVELTATSLQGLHDVLLRLGEAYHRTLLAWHHWHICHISCRRGIKPWGIWLKRTWFPWCLLIRLHKQIFTHRATGSVAGMKAHPQSIHVSSMIISVIYVQNGTAKSRTWIEIAHGPCACNRSADVIASGNSEPFETDQCFNSSKTAWCM